MSDQQSIGDGDPQVAAVDARLPYVRVVGFPGAFAAWGVECVRQILESSGCPTQIVPLEQVGPPPDDTADNSAEARLLFGHAVVMAHPGAMPPARSPAIVFLDAPAWAVHELLSGGHDPMDAMRVLTAALAPLASVLLEEGVLLVQRASVIDLSATQSAIASHLSAMLPLPLGVLPACASIDTSSPAPRLQGQALTLTRQVLTPLANFVAGLARDTIVWPLACFYSGDHPNEMASSVVDVTGAARILYYGPYFYLPRGRWRADVQFFVSGIMTDTPFAIDVFAGEELARRKFRPMKDGLVQISLPFKVDRPESRIEVRVWLLRGAIEGHFGLRQVVLHPVPADAA